MPYAETMLQIRQYLADRDTGGIICCVECGGTKGDFDCSHNNQVTKSFTISQAVAGLVIGIRAHSFTDIQASGELELVSLRHTRRSLDGSKCHARFDGAQLGPDNLPPHGTLSRYKICRDGPNNTRCEKCKAGQAKYQRDLHAHNPVSREAKNKRWRDSDSERRAGDPQYREAVNKRQRDLRARLAADSVWREKENKRRRDQKRAQRAGKKGEKRVHDTMVQIYNTAAGLLTTLGT